ncbi:hypothetical protein S83_042529 [Arachis hypogaea]
MQLEGKTDLKILALEVVEELRTKSREDIFTSTSAKSTSFGSHSYCCSCPQTQEMINEKLKKAEDLGEQGKVDEAQKALEEAEALKKLPTRQEPVVDNSNSSKYIAADVWITDQKLV